MQHNIRKRVSENHRLWNQGTSVCGESSERALGERSDDQNMHVRVHGCMNELKVVHDVRSTEVCEVSLS